MPTDRFRSAVLATRRRRWVAALSTAALLGTGVTLGLTAGRTGNPFAPHGALPVADPEVYTAPAWAALLGGDRAPTAATWAAFDDPARSDLPHADAVTLAALARRVVTADLTGAGRATLTALYPPAVAGQPATVRCSKVNLLAADAANLPVSGGSGRYAKVAVVWTGVCGAVDPGSGSTPQVAYVYAHASADSWAAVRAFSIPVPDTSAPDPQAVSEPASWQLANLPGCTGGATLQARTEVAAAFGQMCTAAAKDGVTLLAQTAYRTRSQQAALFASAVHHYGSVTAARRWVAYADATTCTSKHCAGTAVDLATSPAALGWLSATVGCDDAGVVSAGTSCAAGATPVPRSATFGFVAPAAQLSGYYEFVVALGSDGPAPADCNPVAASVPVMVASIFRCRLARAGVRADVVERIVAEALVVSRAESSWNASALAYAGRFATAANPVDGKLYTQAGVFMISASLADAGWVAGGSAALGDPVANINGAASLWLATRGFEQFGCATGGRGGFETGPVLPEFGGPALPAWASKY